MRHRACLFLATLCVPLGWSIVAGCGAEFSSAGGAAEGGTTTTTTTTTTAAGGTGGVATSGGAGGTVATGGTTTGAEDCVNSLDDDGDQLVDCEDGDCTGGGFACLLATDGWSPIAIAPGLDPLCSGVYDTLVAVGGLGVTSAQPPDCACGGCSPPANAGCGGSSATFYTQQGCGGTAMTAALAPDGCSGVGGGPTGTIIVQPPALLGGSCSSVISDVNPSDEPTFTNPARLCEGAELGAGCDAATACAPPAGGPRCAVKPGDLPCPAPFVKTKYFTDYVDERTCNCSCQLAGGCTGSVSFHGSNTCSGSVGSVPANGQCQVVPSTGNPIIYAQLTATPNASCQAHASPSGSVVPSGPYTLCCLP